MARRPSRGVGAIRRTPSSAPWICSDDGLGDRDLQPGLVGEVAVDDRLGGARGGRDLLHRHVRAAVVDACARAMRTSSARRASRWSAHRVDRPSAANDVLGRSAARAGHGERRVRAAGVAVQQGEGRRLRRARCDRAHETEGIRYCGFRTPRHFERHPLLEAPRAALDDDARGTPMARTTPTPARPTPRAASRLRARRQPDPVRPRRRPVRARQQPGHAHRRARRARRPLRPAGRAHRRGRRGRRAQAQHGLQPHARGRPRVGAVARDPGLRPPAGLRHRASRPSSR